MRTTSLALVSASIFAMSSLAFADVVAPDMVAFEDGAVTESLTGVPGDAANGRNLFKDRKLGNCLACHTNTDQSDQSFHGEVGPSLDGVADRWDTAQLRGILVNSKMMFEGTIMPSFYRTENGARTMEKFQGKSILTAEQIEDVLAYLQTLKE